MKRALAERAKQSGLPNGVASPEPPSAPPLKIPRVENNAAPTTTTDGSESSLRAPLKAAVDTSDSRAALAANTGTIQSSASLSSSSRVTTSGNALSPRGRPSTTSSNSNSNATTSFAKSGPSSSSSSSMKRQRSEMNNKKLENTQNEDDENDDQFSAFYLKHQNRALVSELKSLQCQLRQLERERDYRRNQCRQACQSLNALQATWTQMETALQMGQAPPPLDHSSRTISFSDQNASLSQRNSNSMDPLTTGSGKSVELIGALMDSLASLGNTATRDETKDTHSSEIDGAEKQQLDDLIKITDNVAQRATTLQQWIWSLIQRLEQVPNSYESGTRHSHNNNNNNNSGNNNKNDLEPPGTTERIALLSKQFSEAQALCTTYQSQLEEVAKARDEIRDSERRVRRGLYRLAAGRVKLDEVLKAIEKTDEDKEAAVAWMEAQAPSIVSSSSAAAIKHDVESNGEQHLTSMDTQQMKDLKTQLVELDELSKARETEIEKLLAEREEQMKRINELSMPKVEDTLREEADEAVKQSRLFIETTTKLSNTERLVREMEEKIVSTKQKWAQALGDVDLARKALDELQEKHSKRWEEWTGGQNGTTSETSEKIVEQAQKIMQLEHKLTQALEHVRQADVTKRNLSEAIEMNESLQAKLEEVKAKYGALQAGRSSSNSSSGQNNSSSRNSSESSAVASVSTPKSKSSGTTSISSAEKSEKSEKIHRDYRRMRKELAAVTASKEAAKAKLERTEKDRDSLVQTNGRLLKQIAEKDEMNAKSLATILHLKQLTEEMTAQKESLEQQAQRAGQLALASRLATNARERLAEEYMKHKKTLEEQVSALETRCTALVEERDSMDSKLCLAESKMSRLMDDVSKAKARCDELVAESTKQENEKRRMIELLAVAKREAAKATKLSENHSQSTDSSSVHGGFTADQLSTQVSVLKGRLACPVCNHRDKNCILLRCRHMFCKQCVDENIKNRSRKCPACGGRFDVKEVADVWL